jgi:hypothetical protein
MYAATVQFFPFSLANVSLNSMGKQRFRLRAIVNIEIGGIRNNESFSEHTDARLGIMI